MIPRYSRAPMTEIWSSNSKFQIWLDIELYACEAMEKLGTVPKGTSRKVRAKAKINEKRIDAIEKKAADAKVTMKHYEEAVKKVREQKDLKMNDKLVASYYR